MKKLTINDCITLAEQHGGRCLSDEYNGTNAKYRWSCAKEHKFEALYYNVYSGKWCRECFVNGLKSDRETIISTCLGKNIEILSDIKIYKNAKTKMKMKCIDCNYVWNGCMDNIRQRKGCIKCASLIRYNTRYVNKQEIENICLKNNCMLLDLNNYKSQKDRIKIQCIKCKSIVDRRFLSLRQNGFPCSNCFKLKNKLSNALRNRLNKSIKANQKSGSAVRDLGCTIEELKYYLESKFHSNSKTGEIMTWDNWSYEGWHIDHIKPLASFDLTNREQFLKACHYTNLQPLWAEDNLNKRDKY